jgi:hypothetical protein
MIRIGSRKFAYSAAILGLCLGYAAPAYAQATRTWVSGTGDDANPCSRTAPCKTFAGAISKTAAGGEINCIDTGGYGTVTITKSIVIDCTGTFGSILNSGTNGVNINDSGTATPGTIVVVLRGLAINGAGTGLIGVNFTSGLSLTLENVFIENQKAGTAAGVYYRTTRLGFLYMDNVTVTNNGTGTTGGGVFIQPAAGGSIKAVLDRVRTQNNGGGGIRVDASGTTSANGLNLMVVDSESSGNVNGLWVLSPTTGTGTNLMLSRSSVADNTNAGILADGGFAAFRVGTTTITTNLIGVSLANGGLAKSYGDNLLNGNTTDGTFSTPLLTKS